MLEPNQETDTPEENVREMDEAHCSCRAVGKLPKGKGPREKTGWELGGDGA